MALVSVHWNDRLLKAKLLGAFALAIRDAAKVAQVKSPSRRVAASIRSVQVGKTAVVGSPDPLAGILEKGTRPHDIAPKVRLAMKLPDGGFARGSVDHPGTRAQPFLRPASELFPVLYRVRAKQLL
jgi:hypothetical protein